MKKKYNIRHPLERFKKKYIVDDSGCWLWQGSMQPNGYGKFSLNSQTYYAHRASYILHVGEIPDGLVLDHLCRTTQCVNPDHLEPVTPQTNRMRGDGVVICDHNLSRRNCRECYNAHNRECQREYRAKNPEKMRSRYWDNLEKERARARDYYHRKKAQG
jgi:hypothetical protein